MILISPPGAVFIYFVLKLGAVAMLKYFTFIHIYTSVILLVLVDYLVPFSVGFSIS